MIIRQLLYFLIIIIGIIKCTCVDDPQCLYCAKNSLTCVLCKSGYSLQKLANSDDFSCLQNTTCQFNEITSNDGKSCLPECPSTQIDFLNPDASSTSNIGQCYDKATCGLYYSSQLAASPQDITSGQGFMLYIQKQITPITIIQNQYTLDIVITATGISQKQITSEQSNDLIKGFKINGNADIGSLIVVWFSSSKVKIYSVQNGSETNLTLDGITPENDQILDIFISINSNNEFLVNVIGKITSTKQFWYVVVNATSMEQKIVDSINHLTSGTIANLAKAVFINDSTMLIIGVTTTSQFSSFNVILNNGKLQIKLICSLNPVTASAPKLVFVKSKNEFAYFTQSQILTSSLTDCYAEKFSDQAGVISFVLDEEAAKLFTISTSFIFAYSYQQADGIKSLTQLSELKFDNAILNLVSCVSFGFIDPADSNTQLILICNSLKNNDLIQINYDFLNNQVKSNVLFTNNYLIKQIFYAKQLKTLILFGQNTIRVFEGIQSNNANLRLQSDIKNGCLLILQNTFENSNDLQTKRIAAIVNSLTNLNQPTSPTMLIYQINNVLKYNPTLSQISSIQKVMILGTQQQDPILISKSSFLPFSFTSFKLMAMSISLTPQIGNILLSKPSTSASVSSSSVGNSQAAVFSTNTKSQIILDTIIFRNNVESSGLVINEKNDVIIKRVFIHNMTLTNSTLIKIVNCKRVMISELSIYNVNVSDSLSSIISIFQADEVIFQNVNVTLSILNGPTPTISIASVTSLKFNNVLTAGNRFNHTTLFSIIFGIISVDNTYFNTITIRSNMNVQSFRFIPTFISQLNNQTISNPNMKVIGYNFNIRDNIGRFGQQIFVNSNLAMLSQINCFNNSQLAGNGTLYFSQSSVNIQDSTFDTNKAYGGGAIYFNQTTFANIISSEFKNNSATAAGGSILISQGLLLLNSTKITNSSAYIGGGIRIEKGQLSYLKYDDQTVIENNKAVIFGNNVGSRLQYFKMYLNGQLVTEVNDEQFYPLQQQFFEKAQLLIANAFISQSIRSGQELNIFVQLYDQDDRLFVVDSSITYPPTINLEIKLLGAVMKSNFLILLGDNFIADYDFQKKGYSTTDGLVFQGTPGKTLSVFIVQNFVENPSRKTKSARTLKILENSFNSMQEQQKELQFIDESYKNNNSIQTFENIQQNKTTNQKRHLFDFTSVLGILTSDVTRALGLVVPFRECVKGEILKSINEDLNITECFPCTLNSYTLYNNQTECKKCPDSAQLCENSTIVLKDGYWRSSYETDSIFKCREDLSSCQENTQLQTSHQQQCKKGYTGPLCEGCDIWGEVWGKSYSLNGMAGKCLECDDQERQTFYIALIFIITTFYLLFGIINAIGNNTISSLAYYVRILGVASISQSCMRDTSSQYIKVFVHYLQLFAVINSVSLQLPDFVSFIPKYSGNPGTSFILSSNCFLQQMDYKNIMQARVLQSSLLPFGYCFAVILIYLILSLTKVFKFSKSFIYTTFIFLIMFFQPDSVMFILSSIGCRKLGDSEFLLVDANFECYTDLIYKKFLVYYTIPSLAVWCFIPLVFLVLLRARRNKLHLIVTKKLFGYLYLEYKDEYYYYEFFRTLMKIMIVVFYTLTDSDQQFKLNCVVFFISFYVFITNKLQPYQNCNLAHADTLTHCTLLAVILFNMIILTTKQDSVPYVIMKVLTVVANLGYIFIMILIIITLKSNKYNIIVNKILQHIQSSRIGKCVPFLERMDFNVSSKKIQVLLRWRLLKKNRKNIVMAYFNSKQMKQISQDHEVDKKAIKQIAVSSNNEDIKKQNQNKECSKDNQDESIKQIFSQVDTNRPLNSNHNNNINDQTERMTVIGKSEKAIQQGDIELFSSAFLSQNLDGERIIFQDMEMYSNPVSSKFIFDKNNLLASKIPVSPFKIFSKQSIE